MNFFKNLFGIPDNKSLKDELEKFYPGKDYFLASDSKAIEMSSVFEDHGGSGYFYAVSREGGKQKIMDALRIYNAKDLKDKDKPSVAEIYWSKDGMKSILLINGYPHAVFDFDKRRGYCRIGNPPQNKNWTKYSHKWSDKVLKWFDLPKKIR